METTAERKKRDGRHHGGEDTHYSPRYSKPSTLASTHAFAVKLVTNLQQMDGDYSGTRSGSYKHATHLLVLNLPLTIRGVD